MATDWKQLIKIAAPALGSLAAGNDGAAGSFQRGYARGAERIRQQRAQQEQEQARLRERGAQFKLSMGERLLGMDDPLAFEQLRRLAEEAGVEGGFVQPGAFSDLTFPESKQTAAFVKELSEQLASFEKKGYDLDELSQSGAVIELQDGRTIPIDQAMELAQTSPRSAAGGRIPKPKPAPKAEPQGTIDERAARILQQIEATPDPTEKAALQAQYQTLLKAKGDLAGAGRAPVDPAVSEMNMALKEIQLELAKRRLAEGTGTKPDTDALVEAVIDNPTLWDSLTPSVRSKIAAPLAAKGFDGFGKPLAETAITRMAESRAAVQSLRDLREILKQNEQYIGPVAGFSALNPYSPARKAQADIDRVRQRVGKALEGGVLRKEDEEKYKKILATLTDTPETAIYKVDQLIDTLEKDIGAFEGEQKRAGRRVNTTAAPAAPSGPKVGERRTINGKIGEWDGKGWKAAP